MSKILIVLVAAAAMAICAAEAGQVDGPGNYQYQPQQHQHQQYASDPADAQAEIRSYVNELKHDNSYNYQFETSNGIAAQEQGVGGYYASGSSQYYSPEGQLIQLTYTADENGFQPQGEHLPTPPPIPEAILKSLEWNRQHPEESDDSGHYHEDHHHQHQHQHQHSVVEQYPPSASGLPYEKKV